jgi:hypothetical protein
MALTKVNNDLQDALAAAQPTITSTGTLTNLTVSGEITANGGIALPDDGVLSLGTSDELTLKHHNSGYSHLINTTGTLYVDSDSVTFRDDDGSPSNTVISQTGINITGNMIADGVGIGTSSPRSVTNYSVVGINGTSGSAIDFELGEALNTTMTQTASQFEINVVPALPLIFKTSNSERMRIDSSGRVGIATVPKSGWVTDAIQLGTNLALAEDANSAYLSANAYNSSTGWKRTNSQLAGYIRMGTNDGIFSFSNAVTGAADSAITWQERMRIDSSGNVLVGKTASNSTVAGSQLNANGLIIGTASATNPLLLNRLSTDGDIAVFQKAGTTVGSIGTQGGILYVSGPIAGGLKYSNYDSTHASIFPVTTTGGIADNLHDLGYSGSRFDDIYATNATIQTSDRNEKQDIEELSDAEQRVAVACKGLLRKFRWKDSVAEKGDDARIHFGIIAQDLQVAFAAEGLDAGDYAMFISSTWWETQTEVDSVEAVEATEDTEAVEAADAYTRTDMFYTLAEAPTGATERTRLGVRYPELLAFIISAI